MDQSKLKYFIVVIAIIIFVLLFLGFIYIFSISIPRDGTQGNLTQAPYKVLTPTAYKSGTTVSLYKETPPTFPKEVVLENKILDYSGVVTNAQGKSQMTVSYISDKSMKGVVDFYTKSLPGIGWKIEQTSIYAKVSIIKITKGKDNVLISIAPLQKGGTMVTFQYDK